MRPGLVLSSGGIATLVLWVLLPGGCVPSQPAAPAAQKETPPLKDQMRLPWEPALEGGIRSWLVCGPFPPTDPSAPQTPAPTEDYLAAVGGEAHVVPAPGAEVRRADGAILKWAEYTSKDDPIDVRLAAGEKGTTGSTVYFATTIRQPHPRKAGLCIISREHQIKVFLNGQEVAIPSDTRAYAPTGALGTVALKEGDNRLLLRVYGWREQRAFHCRLVDEALVSLSPVPPLRGEILTDRPERLAVRTDPWPDPRGRTVTVQVFGPCGKVLAPPRQVVRGSVYEPDTSSWPEGPCEVHLTATDDQGLPQVQYLLGYKGDPIAAARRVHQECIALPADSDDPAVLKKRLIGRILELRLGIGAEADQAAPATTQLASRPAREIGRGDRNRILSALMEYQEVAQESPQTLGRGGFYRLAWRDEVDDSPQFARVYLPMDYDPNRKYPMIVQLHGYSASNPEYARSDSADRHKPWTDHFGVILLQPYGRGNTSYRGIGEVDVLRAMALARQTLSIDDDRIYLTGQSMGGGGAWYLATRHTDVFAAVAPIFGGWDYHTEANDKDFARWTRQRVALEESYSTFAQAEAMLDTPVFVLHGDVDTTVPTDNSRYIVRMLQRWGYPMRYHEVPGKGHEGLGVEDETVVWFLTHTLQRAPRHVRLRAPALDGADAHWLHAEQQEDPFALMLADAKVAESNVIRLASQNILQIRLNPPRELLEPSAPVKVIWNDCLAYDGPLPESGQITLRAPSYAPGRRVKEAQGPTPFAIVVGTTAKDPVAKRFCQVLAQRARDEWKTWQHVEPRVFIDTEMTDEQVRKYSLVLYGGPEENAVTARLIKDIPLTIERNRITLDGRAFEGGDAAVRMVYPHPRNANRGVTILAANSASAMFRAGRLPDDADYAIDDGRIGKEADYPLALVAWGRFDHNWRLDEKYLTLGDPSVRAAAARFHVPSVLSLATPQRQVYLADVLETDSCGSFTVMMRNLNWQAGPIRLGGKTHARGIAVQCWHERCLASYDLAGGDWKRLRATIGIELEPGAEITELNRRETRVLFIVRGDGKELYRSPAFGVDSKPLTLDVDVAGVKTLELEVGNQGRWHNAAASVDWAELRLEK